MTEFMALRPKTYCYLMDCGNSDKNAKGTKKCVIKWRLKFNDYKDCLLDNVILKSQQIFQSKADNVYTEGINNIALSRMLRSYKPMTELQYILMVQVLENYAKQNC